MNISRKLIQEVYSIYEGVIDKKISNIEHPEFNRYWRIILGKAKTVFKGRMPYVNWFFSELEKREKFSYTRSMSTVYADDALDTLEHYYNYDLPKINNLPVVNYSLEEVLGRFEDIEKELQEGSKGIIPVNKVGDAEEILVCSDTNYVWFDLHTLSCREESKAMGHCGADPTGDTLFSLREKKLLGNKLIGWKPHVTATFHEDEKRLSQVKGRENKKPIEKYHPFIVELIENGLVEDFGGGSYLSTNDFGWGDISDRIKYNFIDNGIIPYYLFINIINSGNWERIKECIINKADVTADNNLLIRLASANGRIDIVKLLIENGADVTVIDNFPVRLASANGYIDIVKLLIENGADVTDNDNNAIKSASRNGHIDIIKLLIENGADVTAEDNYAIRYASENGHTDVVKLLKKYGAKL